MDDAVPAESPSAIPAPIRLRAVPSEQAPVSPVASTRLTNLPRPLTSLIGREADVAAVRAMVVEDGVRLLTLTGPGGVGKTRLAVRITEEAAAAFADGAVFVPLAAVSDPALVLSAIARAFDIRESSGHPLREALAAALQDRRLLLVLDNFEHVTGAAGDLSDLLNSCPDLTILATGRAPLSLSGERRFATTPLALPAPGDHPAVETLMASSAITLFVDRARWVSPDFVLTSQNVEAVSEICRRLDGLPLAIELAAAWIRLLPAERLLERLETRLPLLRGGAADQPARLRTMRDAIAWSYDLLAADEARLFRHLAIFAGGFTLEAAERIGSELSHHPDAPSSILDLLAALIDKSLLQVQRESAESRILMLETVREFALERLGESGEAAAVAAAHASYMADFAEAAEPYLLGPEERLWRFRCDSELGNLRAALTWSLEHDVEIALRIGASLWLYWDWNLLDEGRRWLAASLKRASDEPILVRARAFTAHGALASLAGDRAANVVSGTAAVPLAVTAGDAVTEGLARWVEAASHFFEGSIAAAGPELDQALILLEQATTSTVRTQAALVRSNRGVVAFATGDVASGIAHYELALDQARVTGSDAMKLIVLGDFAGWLWDLGETTHVRGMAQEALALAKGHAAWLVASPLSTLALVAASEDAMMTAARQIGAADAAWRLSGQDAMFHFQRRLDRAETLAKAAIGEAAFAAARAAGSANLQDVIGEALHGAPSRGAPAPDKSAASFGLSPRQREVLALIVAGRSDQQIGDALYISRRTASHHVAAIMSKLDARTRGDAAVRAVRDGLI